MISDCRDFYWLGFFAKCELPHIVGDRHGSMTSWAQPASQAELARFSQERNRNDEAIEDFRSLRPTVGPGPLRLSECRFGRLSERKLRIDQQRCQFTRPRHHTTSVIPDGWLWHAVNPAGYLDHSLQTLRSSGRLQMPKGQFVIRRAGEMNRRWAFPRERR